MQTKFVSDYKQFYVTNRLLTAVLKFKDTKASSFNLVRMGRRLEWSVLHNAESTAVVFKDIFSNSSNGYKMSSPSSTSSLKDDSRDAFRRPYDSHVNLAAGRQTHNVTQ